MDKIKSWLESTEYKEYSVAIASADASFRKYYRLRDMGEILNQVQNDGRVVQDDEQPVIPGLTRNLNTFSMDDKQPVIPGSTRNLETLLLMDASLEKESLHPFLDVTQRLHKVGVLAPQIYKQDLQEGYLILEDFGDTNLLSQLRQESFEALYIQAIEQIILMQKADTKGLPLYDKAFLHFEMDLMGEWYLQKLLGWCLDTEQQKLLAQTLDTISEVVLSQPQGVFVHRDFHSRNVMCTSQGSLGIIDYQDAMCGALTYDLVSLLKDCYISYEREKIEKLALIFRDKKALDVADEVFLKWFDFMGLQRHIKVLGVFSRLWLRDGKEGYLGDIPLTLSYVLETASRYKETEDFAKMLKDLTSKR